MPIKHKVKLSALLGIEAARPVLYFTYSKSYVGHALTVLKDLPINALKKLTQSNIHAVIQFSMPSKMTLGDFLRKCFSENTYFG